MRAGKEVTFVSLSSDDDVAVDFRCGLVVEHVRPSAAGRPSCRADLGTLVTRGRCRFTASGY
jgi:hypothetical protein